MDQMGGEKKKSSGYGFSSGYGHSGGGNGDGGSDGGNLQINKIHTRTNRGWVRYNS